MPHLHNHSPALPRASGMPLPYRLAASALLLITTSAIAQQAATEAASAPAPAAPASAVPPQPPQTVSITGRRARELSETPTEGYRAAGTSLMGFELDLQEVPATVNILTADFLKDTGSRKITDALNFVPGVTIGDNGGSPREGILIRGFAANPTVNGLPQAITTRAAYSLVNVERIEVIKGVAGVEGNVGDFGGSLDIVTKKPQRETARSIELGLGDHGFRALTTDLTGPIAMGGALQYRLIANWEQSAVWRPGMPRNNPRGNLYPSLNWDYAPGSNLLLELAYERSNQPLDRGGLYIEDAGFPGNFTPRDWSIHQESDAQRIATRQADLTWNHRISNAWSAKINLQAVRVRETTLGFRNGDTEGGFLYADDGRTWNGSGLEIPIYLDDSRNRHKSSGITAELRGRMNLGDTTHTLKLGLQRSSGDDSFSSGGNTLPLGFYAITSNTVNLFDPVNDQQPDITGLDGPYYAYYNRGERRRSAYVQWLGEWTPRWRTLLGVRQERKDSYVREEGGDPAVIGYAPYVEDTRGARSRALRIASSYDVSDETTGFVSWSDGSFAQSGRARDDSVLASPELVTNIEAGLKQSLAGGSALFTAALYQLTRRNLLAPDCLASEVDCNFQKLVGGYRVRGVELELQGEVFADLQISTGLSLARARITESPAGFAGNRVSNTPLRQLSLFANYGWGGLGLAPLHTSLGITHVSDRFGNSGNTIVLPAYTRVDLGARWAFDARTALALNVTNLLDKTYYTAMQDGDSAASDQVAFGERRLAQITLNHRF
jgi:iron complex outermembrane recepter protein